METGTAELVDDGEKRDNRGRRRLPRERVQTLLEEYDRSGVTAAEFARRAGIKYATFAGWVHQRRNRRNQPLLESRPVRFAEVRLRPPGTIGAELSVTLPDGSIVRGGSAAAVAELVRALRC